MILEAERIRGLLGAKNWKQTSIPGVTGPELGKWLCDDREPSLADLKRLTDGLDAASDFLIGLGDDYGGSYQLAAAKMAFGYFDRDPSVDPQLKDRCRRIFVDDELLKLQGAPRTADEWRTVARIIDRATPRAPVRIDARGA